MNEEPTSREDLRRRAEEAESALAELAALYITSSKVDVETGLLDSTGVMEAIRRSQAWRDRRGDRFALVAMRFSESDKADFAHHSAVVGAGLREVDEVGRVDDLIVLCVINGITEDAGTVIERLGRIVQASSPSASIVGREVVSEDEPLSLLTAMMAAVDEAQEGHVQLLSPL